MDKPTLPPEAQVQDHTGATAFVYYWWDHFNYALATGDSAELAAISSNECVFCAGLVEQIDDRAEQLQHTEGGVVTVIDAAAPPDPTTTVYLVGSVVQQAAGTVLDEDGATVNNIPAIDRARAEALVFYEDGAWVMDGTNLEVLE